MKQQSKGLKKKGNIQVDNEYARLGCEMDSKVSKMTYEGEDIVTTHSGGVKGEIVTSSEIVIFLDRFLLTYHFRT